MAAFLGSIFKTSGSRSEIRNLLIKIKRIHNLINSKIRYLFLLKDDSHLYCREGHTNVLKKLLEAGLDNDIHPMSCKNKNEETPLMCGRW